MSHRPRNGAQNLLQMQTGGRSFHDLLARATLMTATRYWQSVFITAREKARLRQPQARSLWPKVPKFLPSAYADGQWYVVLRVSVVANCVFALFAAHGSAVPQVLG